MEIRGVEIRGTHHFFGGVVKSQQNRRVKKWCVPLMPTHIEGLSSCIQTRPKTLRSEAIWLLRVRGRQCMYAQDAIGSGRDKPLFTYGGCYRSGLRDPWFILVSIRVQASKIICLVLRDTLLRAVGSCCFAVAYWWPLVGLLKLIVYYCRVSTLTTKERLCRWTVTQSSALDLQSSLLSFRAPTTIFLGN